METNNNNNERPLSAREKREAEIAVNKMMDGGKFEAFMDEAREKLQKLVEDDKEDSAFLLVCRNGKLGTTFAGICGTTANILVMLDDMCDDNPRFEEMLSKFVLGRKLKGILMGPNK